MLHMEDAPLSVSDKRKPLRDCYTTSVLL